VHAPKPTARRRKQQRTVDTRRKIIRAALTDFALVGFEGSSTRRIAELAGVPHSLVLYHFKNKESLWYSTVQEAVEWYTLTGFGRIGPAKAGDPVRRLKRIMARYIRFSAKFPDFFRMLTHENMVGSARLRWLVSNHVGPTVAHVSELIRRSQAIGAVVEGDPIYLVYLFLGTATSPYRSAREIELLTGARPDSDSAVQRHIEVCERLFFRTPAAGKQRRKRAG